MLEHIVIKALRKDREERYQSIKDLLIDLKDLKRELEIESHLQRSAPRTGATAPAHVTDGQEPGRTASAQATADSQVRTTSSAEYLIGEIKRHKKGFAALFVVLALAAAGGGFGLYWLLTQPKPRVAGPPMRVVPFTTYDGNQGDPAFSPDGNQIAFSWNGEKGDNNDIYVKLVDGGTPLRLTTHPGRDYDPAWAPDGRSLAFYRQSSEGNGYYRVSALGGVERLLAEVLSGCNVHRFVWSPDGKALITSEQTSPGEPAAIYSITVETGERRKLFVTPQDRVDAYPAVSPDGNSIAFFRTRADPPHLGDVYVGPISGGEPKQITFDNLPIYGLAWSADGSEIVFSSPRGGGNPGNLWRAPASGGTPEPVAAGTNAIFPTIARQGGRLAFGQSAFETNIYRVPVPKQSSPSSLPARFISSTLNEDAPQYSPDGKRIAFSSNRSGSSEIWVCDSEGLNAVQLTSFGNSAPTGTPRWSRDGRWLYFGSRRSGNLQIWKMPAEGGQALQLTKQGGFEGFEEASGRVFYYAKGRGVPGIWKVPVEGGEETPVVETDKAGFWRNWVLTEQGIYFANSDQRERPVIEFFSFATSKVTKLITLDRPMNGTGIALSPEGRWLLFSYIDQQRQNIMLVESFR